MKKILLFSSLIIVLVLFLFNTQLIQAQTGNEDVFTNIASKLAPIEEIFYAGTDATPNPAEIIMNIIKILLGFLGVIFVILIIYGGFMWMTSGGNEEKIRKAKDLLKQALVGLIIILSSYAVAIFIQYLYAVSTGATSEWMYHY